MEERGSDGRRKRYKERKGRGGEARDTGETGGEGRRREWRRKAGRRGLKRRNGGTRER